MKILLLQILACLCAINAFASHIVGGEVFYKYLGQGSAAGTSRYQVALRLFRDCTVDCGNGTNVACLPAEASVSIFNAASPYSRVTVLTLPLDSSLSITMTTYPSCVFSKPVVCYEVKTYTAIVTLADNNGGYVISYQDCCRAQAVNQLGVAHTLSGIPGATYTADIPGLSTLPTGHNTSAIFKLKDTALVCLDRQFTIDFSADDADGDSLSYAFTAAYDGGDFWSSGCTFTDLTEGGGCNQTQSAGAPPYNYITYNNYYGFSGIAPLGNSVSINPATGLISGAVEMYTGHYIVNVVVYEWRNHKIIASHRKDFIIHVEDCNIPDAKLDPFYLTCKGYDLNFLNNSTSPLIHSYYWDFGDTTNNKDTSESPTPAYTYSDSGTYVVTLITNKGEECSDTAQTLAKVYPGFIPDFSIMGGCISAPFQFKDLTTSKYGKVNNWRWDFGDFATTADTSIVQNPAYTYLDTQQAQVRLIVGNSKGCIDTVYKIVQVNNTLAIQMPFRDTLICMGDQLQLQVINTPTSNSPTTFNWTPAVQINNTNVSNPIVSPKSTTTYYVTVDNSGCNNTDSVKVNVIPNVIINAGRDTTICLTDSIQLLPNTNALHFTWSPATGISDSSIKSPFVRPLTNTQYTVVATVGHCSATDDIMVQVVPYPQVVAGADTAICYGGIVHLTATSTAPYFAWTPTSSLLQANTLTPTAKPYTTTAYVVTVKDVKGCPKPVSDTTTVTVYPKVNANAGRDTAIVANQPLQLNATGGTTYIWTPVTGLSNPFIADPVVTLSAAYDSMTYHVTVTSGGGCSAGDDIKIIVFKTRPDIFVPTAFTPNGDGLNDRIKAIPIGIKAFQYLKIFNRWGELVFATADANISWDGSIKGQPQSTGVFTWMARGIDYSGAPVVRKGTLTLIR